MNSNCCGVIFGIKRFVVAYHERPMRAILLLLLNILLPFLQPDAYAAALVMRETDECPLAAPYFPRSYSADKNHLAYRLNEYPISRIEMSSSSPIDLEVTWIPVDITLGAQSTRISLAANKTQCLSLPYPFNSPAKGFQIQSNAPLDDVKIALSPLAWDQNQQCPAAELCPIMAESLQLCASKRDAGSCDSFVENIRQLTTLAACRGDKKNLPIPTLWLCDSVTKDPKLISKAIVLLKDLPFSKAQSFFKSEAFQKTIEGLNPNTANDSQIHYNMNEISKEHPASSEE